MKRRAFTLVELLVVLVLVAVLLSVVLPSLGRSMGLSRSGKCLSNVRAIAQGIAHYRNTFWRYPAGYHEFGPDGEFERVWVCPSSENGAVYPLVDPSDVSLRNIRMDGVLDMSVQDEYVIVYDQQPWHGLLGGRANAGFLSGRARWMPDGYLVNGGVVNPSGPGGGEG